MNATNRHPVDSARELVHVSAHRAARSWARRTRGHAGILQAHKREIAGDHVWWETSAVRGEKTETNNFKKCALGVTPAAVCS